MGKKKCAETVPLANDEAPGAIELTKGVWVEGPIDWPDVELIQRALSVWYSGERVDFQVSEDLFYKLLACKGKDDDEYFEFGNGKIRWRNQTARNHEQRQMREATNTVANVDFPTTLSGTARWYCFAQLYVECSFPDYARQALEAKDFLEAEEILQEVVRQADGARDAAAKNLLSTPQKPASAYLIAKQERDDARKAQRLAEDCLGALRAESDRRVKCSYIVELEERGLSAALIDYPGLLELTTFGTCHLGEMGGYSLRMHGGKVVGIDPGHGTAVFHPLFEDEELRAAADTQRSALLNLPCRADRLVHWVFAQGGAVYLALPNSQEISFSPAEWAECVALVGIERAADGVQGGSSSSAAVGEVHSWRMIPTPKGAKPIRVLLIDALNALETLPDDATAGSIITWLLENRSHSVKDTAGRASGPKTITTSALGTGPSGLAGQTDSAADLPAMVKYRDGHEWRPLTASKVLKALKTLTQSSANL